MMDIKEIKQIVDLMKRSDLSEFEIEGKDIKLHIKRNVKQEVVSQAIASSVTPPLTVLPSDLAAPATQAAPSAGTAPAEQEDPNLSVIKSPMVGTFYRAPSPESSSFVEVNSKVTQETVVCIIEAMKVMNEIQAEQQGTVVEILVENGQAVEFGQPLFKVKK